MKEQVKAIIYDFKNAGWTVQKIEQALKFSNGSLGKPISEFRYQKLLELHKKEIGNPVTVTKELAEKIKENNRPETKKAINKTRNPPKKGIEEMSEELANKIIAIQTQPKPSFIDIKNFKAYKEKQIEELNKQYKKL